MSQTISVDGLAFIRGWESFVPRPMKPTPADRWTIGYGMTVYPSGVAVAEHDPAISPADALSQFNVLVRQFEAGVRPLVKVAVTQPQWDALISLAYNIGVGDFATSTVLRDLNKGDLRGAADAFLMWDEQAHKVLPGLDRRRRAERDMFLSTVAPQ